MGIGAIAEGVIDEGGSSKAIETCWAEAEAPKLKTISRMVVLDLEIAPRRLVSMTLVSACTGHWY